MKNITLGLILIVALLGCQSKNISDLKMVIDEKIVQANFCTTPKDCTVKEFGCPFGCNSIISRAADTNEIQRLIERYQKEGADICMYGCTEPPKEFSCIEHKCIASQTINDVVECEGDFDCGIGGCSLQVCGKKGEVDDLITTCEMRPQYECLQKTSCGCTDNKCAWIQNQEYLDCISKIQ